MFNLYRRLLFAIIINFFDRYAAFQLLPFSLIGVIPLVYILYWQPLEKPLFNHLAIFNECLLVFMGYQMYLFTDYVIEPEKRYELGKIMLVILYFQITINLVVLGAVIGRKVFLWTKQQYFLTKHKLTMNHLK